MHRLTRTKAKSKVDVMTSRPLGMSYFILLRVVYLGRGYRDVIKTRSIRTLRSRNWRQNWKTSAKVCPKNSTTTWFTVVACSSRSSQTTNTVSASSKNAYSGTTWIPQSVTTLGSRISYLRTSKLLRTAC